MPQRVSRSLLRSLEKEAQQLTDGDGGERYIDFAIELHTVKQSAAGAVPAGTALPPLVYVGDPVRFGGKLDTVAHTFVGEPDDWSVWLVGERQRDILLCDSLEKTRTLLYSAEGGGKTVMGGMWLVLQAILLCQSGHYGALGATAPTHDRLGELIKAIGSLIPLQSSRQNNPLAWGTHFVDAREIALATGHRIQLRQTQRASAASGSPIQGMTWLRLLADEMQDSVEQGSYPDMEARLRGAQFSRIMATATAKDSSGWRNWRDSLSDDWQIERIRYTEAPFIHPEHWDRMKRNISPREWQRRGLALDVGPERQTYTTWSRDENLVPIPDVGAVDVTAEVLGQWGPNLSLLVGHDPGRLCDVSVMLKAYRLPGHKRHVWWIVDELTTLRSTSELHVAALLTRLREKWHCNETDWRGQPSEHGNRALVRADPYSDSGADENKPHRSVYTVFRSAGLKTLPAAIASQVNKVKVGRIPKEAGINMVCSLLCNAANERRLFVATDDRGAPVAPKTVEAFELSERDAEGKAETQKKDKRDLSHWAAAVRYALWALERPRYADPLARGVNEVRV